MKNICIYHKSCADGFGAALAVKVYFDQYDEKCDFLSAHYGDEAPDVTGLCLRISQCWYWGSIIA